jgi:hypothetical protein
VRAGLYGGGKDKSTGLASLTQSSSGVLEVARRLSCGKSVFEACAAASTRASANGVGGAVAGSGVCKSGTSQLRPFGNRDASRSLYRSGACTLCVNRRKGLQKPGENRNRKREAQCCHEGAPENKTSQPSQALKGWTWPATGQGVEHV